MWLACGTRIRSAIVPPNGPQCAPSPYAASINSPRFGPVSARASRRVVVHLDVSPRRQFEHSPQEIDHGTTTLSPTASSATSEPRAVTSAIVFVPDRERSLERNRPTYPPDRGIEHSRAQTDLHRARDGLMQREGIAVAAAAHERTHDRVGRDQHFGLGAIDPCQLAGAEEVQFSQRAQLVPVRWLSKYKRSSSGIALGSGWKISISILSGPSAITWVAPGSCRISVTDVPICTRR